MARFTSCSAYGAKTEEEFSRESNGRPKIGPHAKMEEDTAGKSGMGPHGYAKHMRRRRKSKTLKARTRRVEDRAEEFAKVVMLTTFWRESRNFNYFLLRKS